MIDEKELLSMKIIHYFITNEKYNPIIIKGITDEVWLENRNGPYSIIRIVTRHILNEEQFEYDLLKTKHITKQIRRKTLDLSMNILSIYLDSDYKIDNNNNKNINIIVKKDEDFRNNKYVSKYYKNVKEKFIFNEEGFDLITKLTSEIARENIKENEKREKLMKNKKPIITLSLISINVIIFVLMYLFGSGSLSTKTLIDFGANYIPYTKAGEYYRLLTSAFLHIGIIHLVLNMYSLFIIGTHIEFFYGKLKYIFIYLYSAIIGSLFTVILSTTNTVAAGASGAIFGLLGAMLYFGYHYRGYIGNAIISQVVPIVLLNLFFGFITPGIGNAAHIGGLIGGYIVSMAVGFDNDNKTSKIHGTIISIILLLFLIYISFFR
ncbi:MAG: rhomboid family intramembrane serine protease [Bacilli bacterium]|nr:rhomboid family intramembrane serine protease [Bacilli bacterium]